MASILIRTLIVYLLLSISLRIMGKRQLGELDISELVSTLLISEIASIPIDDPDIPLLNAVIPILFILSIEIILSTLKNKSKRLQRVVEGNPEYIIYKGRLLQENLKNNRISINELLSKFRTQGLCDPAQIDYAIIEQGGELSVIKKGEVEFAHAIIIDGYTNEEELGLTGFDKQWLNKVLAENETVEKNVMLMTLTDSGKVNIIKKDGSLE